MPAVQEVVPAGQQPTLPVLRLSSEEGPGVIFSFIHNLFYEHASAVKDDIGEFRFCVRRLGLTPASVYFKPAGSDRWHRVPAPVFDGETGVYRHMLFAAGPDEAMAMLRAAMAEESRYA